MKTPNVLVLLLALLCIDSSTQWPTHTVCKEDNLEIHYKSCDPQQDFAFSIDRCSDVASHTFNIRAAMVLRHSIKELYAKLDLIINRKTVLTYKETLCGQGHDKLIFCGKKKGGATVRKLLKGGFVNRSREHDMSYGAGHHIESLEHLYYEGPVTLGIKEIPQGDYTISAKLTNEDQVLVACADFTVKNYLDYY